MSIHLTRICNIPNLPPVLTLFFNSRFPRRVARKSMRYSSEAPGLTPIYFCFNKGVIKVKAFVIFFILFFSLCWVCLVSLDLEF